MSSRLTLATVARAAGVSPASVSNAYNRPERLSAAVRERILAVAEELGYPGPDPAARSLRSRHAAAIGVLFTSGLSYAFSDPYCIQLLQGVADVAERVRTSLVLMPLVPHTASLDEEATRESVRAVRDAVVDGVIADGIADDHPALAVLKARGLPLVRSRDDPETARVLIEDRGGGRLVGAHLRELGHRSAVVLVDGPDARQLFPYAADRAAGVEEGLAAAVTVVPADANRREDARTATLRLLATKPAPTAIAAVTDVLALGAMDALREAGLEPGRDVSVTGFDDAPAATIAGLTTVRQPIAQKGRLMARMLLDTDFKQRRVVLPTELVVRGSTGPVPPG